MFVFSTLFDGERGEHSQKKIGALTSLPSTNDLKNAATQKETNNHFNVDWRRDLGHRQTLLPLGFSLGKDAAPFLVFFLLASCSRSLKILFLS